MSDTSFLSAIVDAPTRRTRHGASKIHSLTFAVSKHIFDVVCAVVSLPLIAVIALVLLVLNPFLNPGPLFYSQKRMGKNHRPFTMVKFRTMLPAGSVTRGHDCRLEENRITWIGGLLRRYRIDELPNMFNVLARQMSVVGPRPDTWAHAVEYARIVPLYDERHRVRPGITGLAQVEQGYAEGIEQTKAKALLDALYIEAYGFRQEARVLAKTFRVLTTGFGAR